MAQDRIVYEQKLTPGEFLGVARWVKVNKGEPFGGVESPVERWRSWKVAGGQVAIGIKKDRSGHTRERSMRLTGKPAIAMQNAGVVNFDFYCGPIGSKE